MADSKTVTDERHRQLYGKGRKDELDQLKQTLSKSSVLQPGEYNIDLPAEKLGLYTTTNAIDFQDRKATVQGKQYPDSNMQLKEHFKIGNDSGQMVPSVTYQLSATKDDHSAKDVPTPLIMKESRVVNWPDMAPNLSIDRTLGRSEYVSSFPTQGVEPARPQFPRLNMSKNSMSTTDIQNAQKYKGVSVTLGSDSNSYETENQSHYNGSGKLDTQAVNDDMKNIKWTSHVFRDGDYNGASQSMASTVDVDYGKRSHQPTSFLNGIMRNPDGKDSAISDDIFSRVPKIVENSLAKDTTTTFKDAMDGRKDQTSAHFVLGSDGNQAVSTYKKDISQPATFTKTRPHIYKAPKASEVLQMNPDYIPKQSVTAAVYGSKVFPMAVTLNDDLQTNVAKNASKCYDSNITTGNQKENSANDRQKSLSHGDYLVPPKEFKAMQARTAPKSAYNYLETEIALPHPVPKVKTTQTQYNSTGGFMDADWSVNQRKQNKNETKPRARSGIKTHFTFGTDELSFKTEQKLKFDGKPRQDQNILPAGKTEKIPAAKFDHVKMTHNTNDEGANTFKANTMESMHSRQNGQIRSQALLPLHNASLMQNDYMHPKQREFTEAQSLMLKQDEKLSRRGKAASHLFHMDNTGVNFQTTAATDFIKPENMQGRTRLAAT